MTGKNYSDVEKLEVYKRAYIVSLALHTHSLSFPKIEQFALADQVRRSSKSICANLSEGFGKQDFSKLEFRRFVLMAIGSAHETRTWVKYCRDLKYIDEALYSYWTEEYTGIINMLRRLWRSIS